MGLNMINAWAVEVLESDGYRYIDIKRTQQEAINMVEQLGGQVVPLNDFDWHEGKMPFLLNEAP